MTGRERVHSDHQLPAEEFGAEVALPDVDDHPAAAAEPVDRPPRRCLPSDRLVVIAARSPG